MSLLSTPLLFALVIIILTLLWLRSVSLARSKRIPPSIPGLPLFGGFFHVYPYISETKMHKFFEKYHGIYGKIFCCTFFNKTFASVADARCGKEILTTTDKFFRNETLRLMMRGMGDYQLFTLPSGALWQKHRKYMQPSFGPSHVQSTLVIARDISLQLVALWNQLIQEDQENVGKTRFSGEAAPVIDVHNHFSSLTLDVIGRLAFSHSFNMVPTLNQPELEKPDLRAFENILSIAAKRFNLPPFLWKFFKVSEEDMKQDAQKIRGTIHNVIAAKKKKIAEGNYDESKLDMLERLIEATTGKAKTSFSEEELVDEILAVFGAGSETTANTLTWCIMALCQNPQVYTKLQATIDDAFPQFDDLPTWESIQKLSYLDSVLRETSRLYPVVGIIARDSSQDVSLMGYAFPSGTRFLVNIQEIHHSAEYWPEPLKFYPERWETGAVPEPGTFLPFGDGPMNCIGQKIAMVEAKTVLCVLLKRFRFVLVPGQDLDPIQTITIGLKHGLNIHVIPRLEVTA